jgi:hypothetical protein
MTMIYNMENYINKFTQNPSDFYKGLNQATIDSVWDNTTQVRKVKEESYPFNEEYTEYEAWVSTVADVTTSTNKVIGNYIELLFRNIDHPLNYRGQKYKYKTDGEREDTYLCYDKLNPLTNTSNTKLIKCNNKLRWINVNNGKVYEEPMFIGWQLMATNNQISKAGTIPERRLVCLVQGNENTRYIHENQRFILSHNKAFKVTQVDDLNLEDLEENATLLTLYIEWCPILPIDNLELNLAGEKDNNYILSTTDYVYQVTSGTEGIIPVTLKYNDNVIENPELVWSSSDSNVIEINELGEYKALGSENTMAIITASLKDNIAVSMEITFVVVSQNTPSHKRIVTSPDGEINLFQGESQEIKAYMEISGKPDYSKVITCRPDWQDNKYFSLADKGNGVFEITNNRTSQNRLTLWFECEGNVAAVYIKLKALF